MSGSSLCAELRVFAYLFIGIIDKEMWEAVQLEMERRKTFAENYRIKKLDYVTMKKPFAGKVICEKCGLMKFGFNTNSMSEMDI